MRAAAAQLHARDYVYVHVQPLQVARETYLRSLECLYRPLYFKCLKIPLITNALLCLWFHVIAYPNVLINRLNVRVKPHVITKEQYEELKGTILKDMSLNPGKK